MSRGSLAGVSPVLDHLVFAGPDLGDAVALVEGLTGVRSVPGGRHAGKGTANHLLGLGGRAYLEIIGPDPEAPEPGGPRPFGIDELREPRLVTWAVQTTDLDADVRAARDGGGGPGTPESMSRRTPGGELLEWRLTPFSHADGPVPFLIDWGDSRHPSEGLPVVPLRSMFGVHPRVEATTALEAIGVEMEVQAGTRSALVTTLEGRTGPVVLL